jgi:hypothetical protein
VVPSPWLAHRGGLGVAATRVPALRQHIPCPLARCRAAKGLAIVGGPKQGKLFLE